MTTKQKVIGVVVLVVVSAAVGRFTAPEKVKIEKEIQIKEVVKEVVAKDTKSVKNKDQRKEVVTSRIIRPDGTIEETSKTVLNTNVNDKKNVNLNKTTDLDKNLNSKESKVVEYRKSTTQLSVMAGVKINDLTSGMRYGGAVSKDVLGPISIGVFGFTDGTCGASLGLRF